MSRDAAFDEKAREALGILLENFWILRDRQPEEYAMIRDREAALKRFVRDKLGYRLIVHRHFAKLEKIPARPEPWMGMETFEHPRDYAMFCCLLAHMENVAVDEPFLLSALCEELKVLYPGEVPMDWENYEHRKSLVRVVKTAVRLGILTEVDGDTAAFQQNEQAEVLYEVPVAARYFMRTFPKDLTRFSSGEAILQAEAAAEEDSSLRRRHRVYRQLLLSPAVYREEMEEADFLYLLRFRHRLEEDFAEYLGFRLEIYRNTALLSAPEARARLTLFPDSRAICDIALQMGEETRRRLAAGEVKVEADGTIRLTPVEWEQWVGALKESRGAGWSKQYRTALVKQTAAELLALLKEWKMATVDPESGMIRLYPLLGRLAGEYPADFDPAGRDIKKEREGRS